MNSSRSSRRAGAFTLVELLCVITILGILAALLLPALSQGRARVKRIACASQLHQAGLAFQIFLHDHGDKFPMAVPMAEGGSRELVPDDNAAGGEFHFAFRHFQVLSNELGTPAILICPADPRLPAANFGALQNRNVSYFIGVHAAPAKPGSILAGDRNLAVDPPPNATGLPGGAETRWQWTRELHRFKGNLLFADGRVEEWNNARLVSGAGAQLAGTGLVLPSDPAAPAPALIDFRNPSGHQNEFSRTTDGRSGIPSPPFAARTNSSDSFCANGPAGGMAARAETGPAASTFDACLVKILQGFILCFYLLILQALLVWLLFAWSQRAQRGKLQRENGS